MGKVTQKIDEFLEFKEGFVDKLNVFFGAWALYVYDHPYTVICIALVFAIIPVFGFLPSTARWVDGADNLYALPVSEARNDGIIHDNMFSNAISRASFMVITHKEAGRNLLTWELLDQVREVDELAQGKRIDPEKSHLVALPANEMYYPEWFKDPTNKDLKPDRDVLTYRDICAPDPVAGCKVQSIFEMGIDDMKLMIPDGADPELWILDGLVFASNKKGFSPDFVLGGATIVPCRREMPTSLISLILKPDQYWNSTKDGYSISDIHCVTEVKALNFVYEVWDKPEFLERSMAWEYVFYNTMKSNEWYRDLHVGAMAFRSRDDELSKSTTESDDVIFVVYTFILLISYAAIMNFSFDQYRNKAISSLSGSLACLMGLFAGLGIPSMMGAAFVPTALVCPFIVMGVGADDIFVLISSYVLAYGEDSPRQKCAVSLRGCGVSVVMTTVTNVIAFAIGIQTPYLSIKNFCIFTLCGLAFSLFFELTFLFAFICLEARKEEVQRACICGMPQEAEHLRVRTKFDITKIVSTYQVVYTLVAKTIEGNHKFDLKIPQAKYQTLPFYKRLWIDFSERGSYWHTPDEAMIQHDGASKPTPSTLSPEQNDHAATDDSDDQDDNLPSPLGGEVLMGDDIEDEEGGEKKPLVGSIHREQSFWKEFLPKRLVVDRYDMHAKLSHPAYIGEPDGNVGSTWRKACITHYVQFLLRPWAKVLVILLFTANLGISIYGLTHLTQGLEMVDLSPDNSYLKVYDGIVADYLNKVDMPVEVFFVGDDIPWHEKRTIESMRDFVKTVDSRPINTFLNDPLTRMYDDDSLGPSLRSENRTEFNRGLKAAVSDPSSPYKQFEYDFVWEGENLVTYRQQLLPAGTKSSGQRASWMLQMRADCHDMAHRKNPEERTPIDARFYNYMLVFFESDIVLMKSVISALSTASLALLVVTLLLIPDLFSGLIVISIMFLIDIAVIGYMALWSVNLNMISMVILVISIGFAVDYSAHICYAFVNAIGPSRDIRTCEAMVLIGTPLVHGAMSNFLGIALLGMSTSYIFRVFFRMMTLVVLHGIAHGCILLPVMLSLVGPMLCGKEVTEETYLEAIKKGYAKPQHSFYHSVLNKVMDEDEVEAAAPKNFNVVAMSAFPVSTAGGRTVGHRVVAWFSRGSGARASAQDSFVTVMAGADDDLENNVAGAAAPPKTVVFAPNPQVAGTKESGVRLNPAAESTPLPRRLQR